MSFEAARLQVVVEEKGIDETTRNLQGLDTQVTKTGSGFGDLTGAVKGFALGVGFQQAGQIMFDMATAAAEDAASVEQLNQAVINAEGSLNGHAASLDRAVAAGQDLAFSDDQIRQSIALMTATTGDADEALRRLSSAQDLARGTGMDLVTASKLLGRVNDENINVLSRYGIQVDKTATAQDLLNAVDQKFEGQAGKFAETDAAKLQRMTIATDELQESMGSLLLPAVVTLSTEVTETAEAISILSGALQDLIPGADGAAESFLSMEGILRASQPLTFAIGDGLQWVAGKLDDTESAGVPVLTFFRDLTATLPDVATEAHNAAVGLQAVESVLSDLTNEADAGGASLDKYGGAHSRAAEMAGLANERNTEALHSIELVGGAAADAAYGLDQMSEATETAWAAQDKLSGIMSDAQGEVSKWESHLSDAESALKILDGEMDENGSLTAEQQKQYDALSWATGRYTGAVEDSEGAVVDAAVAQADFIRIQDDLNTKLANGQISAHDYNVEMGKAAGAIDPAAGASYGLAAAQQTVADTIVAVVEKVEGLLVKLGLIPAEKKTDVSAPGATEAESQLSDVVLAADRVPRSMTIEVHANTLAAQNALNELRAMTFTQSPPKEGPMAFQPDFSYIFDGLPEAAHDVGQRSMQNLADFLPMARATTGPLTRDIDWSWLFAGLDTEAEDYAQRASEAIANHLTSIDLDSILDTQGDLGLEIANLEALQAALTQLGDTAGVEALNADLAALRAEYAALVTLIGTDAVQAWIRNTDAAKLAAEAADAALKAQQDAADAALEAQREFEEEQARIYEQVVQRAADAQQAVIEGLASGGDAAGQFFGRIISDYEDAKAAYDLAALLGVSGDALAQLAEELTNAEVLIGSGAAALQDALLAGLIDPATLQALAAAGGEWFEALYDQLFGVGALDAISDGWNDITDASLEQLQLIVSEMEDGGAEIVDTLVEAIAGGAISYEEALSLLSDATGEEVNAILDELQRLYDALLVDLANALVTGSDPSEIEANMAAIEALMESLADKAVETADKVVKAGKSMAAGYAASLDEMAGTSQDSGSSGSSGSTSRRGGGLLDGMNNPGFDSLDLNGDGIISEKELAKAGVPEGYRWGLSAPPPPPLPPPPPPLPPSAYRGNGPNAVQANQQTLSPADVAAIANAVRQGAREGTSSGFSGWAVPLGGVR